MTVVAYLMVAWAASVLRRYDDVCGWMDDVGHCSPCRVPRGGRARDRQEDTTARGIRGLAR